VNSQPYNNLIYCPEPPIYYQSTFAYENRLKMIEDNYVNYRKKGCKKLHDTIFEELIQRTWHPSRVIDWCWDEDEKKFMNGMLI
jgi:hypothetical protein